MVTAESVYNIATCLSRDEQRKLFYKIADDLQPIKIPNNLKKSGNRISNSEMDDLILERIFKIKLNKS